MLKNKFNLRCLAAALVACSLSVAANDPYTAIIDHQNNGRYDEALSKISSLLSHNENDFRALLLKGNVNKLMGNTDQAIDIFKQLIDKYPHMPEPYNNLAVLYADSGQTSLAIETLQQVFSTSHSYSAAFENLRNLYNEMASTAYREALDIKQKKPAKSSKYTLLNEAALMPTVTVDDTEDDNSNITMTDETNDLSKQIKMVIGDWSSSWSNRNIKVYFSHYHQEFVPPNGVDRKEWERVRGIRLSKPKFIKIDIVGISVQEKSSNLVTAMFEQHYRSDTYKDTVVKVLTFKKKQQRWLIYKEDVL